jgi:hypothetical protein
MSTDDATSTLPRKKPNVLWWILGVLCLVLVLFFVQLFGPNPSILVAPQTTVITAPLAAGGLPDFERYWRERAREGVTPENNAAVLLLPALWPAEFEPSQFAAVAAELGLKEIPSQADALVPVDDLATQSQIAAWLRERNVAKSKATEDANSPGETTPAGDPFAPDPFIQAAEKVTDAAQVQPWTSEEIPPLAKWLAKNNEPLDKIVEAARRPRLYIPSPSLINNSPEMLIAVLLPGIQTNREVARSLPVRAMWHLGEGRPLEAWEDLLAVHRLARLLAQDGRTLVEQLVAIAISGVACDRTVTLLHHGKLTPEQARQVQRDLAALGPFRGMAASIGQCERLMGIDAVLHIASRKAPVAALTGGGGDELPSHLISVISIDWNHVLREMNRRYDKLEAAARLATWEDRSAAMEQLDQEFGQISADFADSPARWLAALVSREQRSQLVSDVAAALLLPAISAACEAEDRGNMKLSLVQLAAALALHRAEQGAYPEKLESLVPGVLPQLPTEMFHSKPFIYYRDGEGYLLYSAGPNGVDDGGNNENLRVLRGQALDVLDESHDELLQQIPRGSDDHAIRVPAPKAAPPGPPNDR